MELYIMRHGTTVWNEKSITQGHRNNRLSSNGKLLIEDVAKKLKPCNFEIIFSSPLMRTMQTANIINKYHNVNIIKDTRLIEVDQGIFTGKSKLNLTEQEIELKKNRDKSCGMESYQQILERVREFYTHISNFYKDKRVLVVTHNIVASMLEYIVNNKEIKLEKDKNFSNFQNGQVKYFKIC